VREPPTLFHGELNRLPWEVVDRGPTWIEACVETGRSPFAVQRRVAVDRGELRVDTAIANVGAAPASYIYGERPCLWRETFAGGRLLLDARSAWVPAPSFTPERAVLRPGERFGRELALELDLAATPHLLLSVAYDDWDMLAVEPVSAPGRGVEDAVAAGAVHTLDPGQRLRTGLVASWHDQHPG
jgi:hypothetical protein